jgi:hypothetical protein
LPIVVGSPLTFTHLKPLPYISGYDKPRRIVVRSQAEWQEVWSAMWDGHPFPQPRPTVDFDREMLIVAAMGARPEIYKIAIQSTFDNAGSVTVRVQSEIVCVAEGLWLPSATVFPMDVIRLPRRDGPVTFVETTFVAPCPPYVGPPPGCAEVFLTSGYYSGYIVMLKAGTNVEAAVADLSSRYGLKLFAFKTIPAFSG